MHDADEELREIKREIIESRGLVIKTNNLTNALSADIKSIAKRQQSYERRLAWNSATAYVVSIVVLLGVFKYGFDARVDAGEATAKHLREENARVKQEIDQLRLRQTEREAAELEAAKFYDLVRQGKRLELIKGWEAMRGKALSRAEALFFSDAIEKAKSEQSALLYVQGLDAVRLQRWQEAATAFEESLRDDEAGPTATRARLELGVSYRKLRKQKDAIGLLEQVAESSVDREAQDDALELLALCQTELEAYNDAKDTWRTLLRKFPDSHYALEAKLALQSLALTH
jgi:TolA-binding protein